MGIWLRIELGFPCGVGAFLLKIDLRRVAKCGKLIVDNKTKSKKLGLIVSYKLGSLFSGVGGLALGFVDAGFD